MAMKRNKDSCGGCGYSRRSRAHFIRCMGGSASEWRTKRRGRSSGGQMSVAGAKVGISSMSSSGSVSLATGTVPARKFDMLVDCKTSLIITWVACWVGNMETSRGHDQGREGFGIMQWVFPFQDGLEYWIKCCAALSWRGFITYSKVNRHYRVSDAQSENARKAFELLAKNASFEVAPSTADVMAVRTLLSRYTAECQAEFEAWDAEQNRVEAELRAECEASGRAYVPPQPRKRWSHPNAPTEADDFLSSAREVTSVRAEVGNAPI